MTVLTPEELQYPTFSSPRMRPREETSSLNMEITAEGNREKTVEVSVAATVEPGHIVVPENTRGWSYRRLFAEYLKGAREVTVKDPDVWLFFQTRNLMELLEVIHDLVPEGDEVVVHLITQSDPETCVRQAENLDEMVTAFTGSRVSFSWELDHNPNFHARSITNGYRPGISTTTAAWIYSKSLRAGRFRLNKRFKKPA